MTPGDPKPMVMHEPGAFAEEIDALSARAAVRVAMVRGRWWIVSDGQGTLATVSDSGGAVLTDLAPGERLPIVDDVSVVISEFRRRPGIDHPDPDEVNLTPSQRMVLAVLCEPALRDPGAGRGDFPTAAQAARRLGWSLTAYNRKLDNVCDKLDRAGVAGLRGGRGNLAVRRRLRLVDYALASGLITLDDVRALP